MKHTILVALLLLPIVKISAQDVIVTQQSERIDARVLRVTEIDIEYKRTSNPDGPSFVIPKEKVSAILFANGEVLSIQVPEQIQQVVEQKQTKQPYEGKFTFTIGYTMAMIKDEKGEYSLKTDMHGIQFGVGVIQTANEYFTFRPSFELSLVFTESGHMFDLKLPLLASIGTDKNKVFEIHAFAGPMFSLGLSAGNDFDLNDYPDIMQRPDISVSIGFGVRYSSTSLDLGYTFGLLNRNDKTTQSGIVSHINWMKAGITTYFN